MKGLISKITVALLALTLFAGSAFAAQGGVYVEAYGLDTVAGVPTYLRTSKVSPGSLVVFDLVKPSGEHFTFPVSADMSGVAAMGLSEYYTRNAGTYLVSVSIDGISSSSNYNSFEVFAGDVSVSKSTVTPSDQVSSTGIADAGVDVRLIDDYGNPIEGHFVKLISSNSKDSISVLSDRGVTDDDGSISFRVGSDVRGASTYTVYDATADLALDMRARVAYFDSSDYLFNSSLPSNFAYGAAVGNSSGLTDYFQFESIPSQIVSGSSVTYTVSAKDADGQTVVNYDGTVRFSVVNGDSSSVSLPGDYTFTPQDLGVHTFSLSTSFLKPGSYVVEVRDLNNFSVFGSQTFVVSASGASSTSLSDGLTITNPVSGTYSNNVLVVSGSAIPGSKIRIYDNDFVIGSTVASGSGAYSFTTSLLSDGLHNLYVAQVNDVGTIVTSSNSVSVNIDTSSPQLANVVIDPSGSVTPGSLVTARIFTQENLSTAALVFQNNIFDMTDSGQGYYEGVFPAPTELGEYPMTFVIVDQLGNESRFENASTLFVGVTPTTSGSTLGDVTALSAVASDHRITLTWTAPTVVAAPLINYRVFYGLSPNQLTEAVDTFTNSTTWYIPNLKNGVEYYFAVVAVDSSGNTSEHLSNIVSSTPNPAVLNVPTPDVVNGTAGADILKEMDADVSETGPEVVWLLCLSVFGGAFYTLSSRRK